MKRHLLTILFVCSFVATSFAARVTTIITSINSNTSEAVTINTAWTGTDGDLVLSASVPASVKVGDTITDNGGNTYLITAISGSNLTSQDFDTTTDPVTGSATIQEAYNTITLWEADLDDTALYVASDDAQGECYDNADFDEALFNFNGGGTVGLNSLALIAATGEGHDGTASVGVLIKDAQGSGFGVINLAAIDMLTQDLIIDGETASHGVRTASSGNSTSKRIIIINADRAWHDNGTGTIIAMNSIAYNINLEGFSLTATDEIYNSTLVKDPDSDVNSIRSGIRTAKAVNCISMHFGGTSGHLDFLELATGSTNNLSSDASGDDIGSGGLINKAATDQFPSVVSGSEDLHLKSGADAFEAGTDLVNTPTDVKFDIDNYDRDAGATTWSMGAHDGNNLRGARRRVISIL